MKKFIVGGLLPVLFLGLMFFPNFVTRAAVLEAGENISLEGQNDDVYVAGGNIVSGGVLSNDAVFAGGQVTVSGSVGQDLMVVGGTVTVSGSVADDLRIAGGNVTVIGSVGGDLVVAGGSVVILPSVAIGGDLIVAGGAVVHEGTVAGSVKVWGGEVTLRGTVQGAVVARAETIHLSGSFSGPVRASATVLSVDTSAQFMNEVEYWQSAGELNFGATLKEGGVARFNPDLIYSHKKNSADTTSAVMKLLSAWFFFSLVSGVVLIGFLLLVASRLLHRAGGIVKESFWKMTGYGMLYFIATPAIIVFLLITVIGWPLAVIGICLYIASLVIATALASVIFAYVIAQHFNATWNKWRLFGVSIAVYLVLKLLMFIPVVGWIAILIAVASAFGSLLLVRYRVYKSLE